MHSSQSPQTLLALFTIFLSCSRRTVAKPFPIPFAEVKGAVLRARCANPCGWSGQLCCTADQQCTTDASGQALCAAGTQSNQLVAGQGSGGGGAGAGYWQTYTTTWVATDLVTRVSTYSSYIAGITAQAATPVSTWAPVATSQPCGIPCGHACCVHGQYCATAGQCVAVVAGGFSSGPYSSYHAPSSAAYAPPLRPTSGTVTTTTSTGAAITATVPFQTPVGTAGGVVFGTAAASGGGGLSTGAIVGIVIAILAVLLLIALFCLTAMGRRLVGGRKRRTETTYIREHHHRHSGGGGGAAAAGGRTWYGGRPSRPQSPRRGGNIKPVLAGLGAIALALGLKKRAERRRKDDVSYSSRSDSSYGYGYSDSGTSASSESTDPRSRR